MIKMNIALGQRANYSDELLELLAVRLFPVLAGAFSMDDFREIGFTASHVFCINESDVRIEINGELADWPAEFINVLKESVRVAFFAFWAKRVQPQNALKPSLSVRCMISNRVSR